MKTIQVNSGADLYSIAEAHLGDSSYWREVALVNGLGVFDAIPINLQIPDPSELESLVSAVKAKDLSGILSGVGAIAGIDMSKLDLSGVKVPSAAGDSNLIDWLIR